MTARIAATTARSNGIWRDREETDHQDRVVQHGEDRAERQPPGVKAQGDVDEDEEQGEEQRLDGARLAARCRPAAQRHRAARTCAPGSTALRAPSRAARAPRWHVCLASGGRRIATSREEPKFCTCGSWKPAAVSCARTASTFAARVKLTSALTPPVKSMARFRPRVKNDAERDDHQHARKARTTPCVWP